MRTRKIILFIAMLAMTFVSCQNFDNIEQVSTSISSTIKVEALLNNVQSKSSAVVTHQDSIKSFMMYMYNDGEAVATNLKFSRPSKTGEAWTHDGVYYWAAGTYRFYGVAQDNSGDNKIDKVSVTKDGITIGTASDPYVISTDGKVSEPTWNGTEYVGGIYADAVTSVSQVDPVLASEMVIRNDVNSGDMITTMNFYHALSRVRVVVDDYDPKTTNLKLVVYGYEFRMVGVKGYISSDNIVSTSAKAKEPVWTITERHAVRENSIAFHQKYDSTWDTKYKSLIPDKSWCNVIPGDVAVALVVKAALYDNTNHFVQMRYFTTSSADIMKPNSLKVGDTYLYKPGYQYTYHVSISGDGGDDTDTDNPGVDDPGHDGPDKGIDGLTIKITSVNVEAWKDVNAGTISFGD